MNHRLLKWVERTWGRPPIEGVSHDKKKTQPNLRGKKGTKHTEGLEIFDGHKLGCSGVSRGKKKSLGGEEEDGPATAKKRRSLRCFACWERFGGVLGPFGLFFSFSWALGSKSAMRLREESWAGDGC
jgi:hypothetical protein